MNRLSAITITVISLLYVMIMAGGCDSMMNKAKYKKLSLQSFGIETGGGMEGGRNILQVRSDTENDIVTVYKAVNNTWYLNPEAEIYVVDSALLDEIKQIIIDEKLYNAPKAPLSEFLAYDAPTTWHKVAFSDGEYFSYSSNQELPLEVFEANNKIREVIREYCKDATAYPTVYVGEKKDYMPLDDKEVITVDCSNSAPFRIALNVHNGKSDKVELTGNVTLSKLDGDKAVSTETLIENHTMEIYANGQDAVTVTFPPDRYPEEGTYRMEYAGYDTVFEMKTYKIGVIDNPHQ